MIFTEQQIKDAVLGIISKAEKIDHLLAEDIKAEAAKVVAWLEHKASVTPLTKPVDISIEPKTGGAGVKG